MAFYNTLADITHRESGLENLDEMFDSRESAYEVDCGV